MPHSYLSLSSNIMNHNYIKLGPLQFRETTSLLDVIAELPLVCGSTASVLEEKLWGKSTNGGNHVHSRLRTNV